MKDALWKTFLNEKTLSYGQIMRVFKLLEKEEQESERLRKGNETLKKHATDFEELYKQEHREKNDLLRNANKF